jgi:hypothetical protein
VRNIFIIIRTTPKKIRLTFIYNEIAIFPEIERYKALEAGLFKEIGVVAECESGKERLFLTGNLPQLRSWFPIELALVSVKYSLLSVTRIVAFSNVRVLDSKNWERDVERCAWTCDESGSKLQVGCEGFARLDISDW